MKKTTLVNLIGAPGAGKSILGYDLTSKLRKDYVSAELVTEAAKDHVYEGKTADQMDQLEIFAEQYKRVKRLNGKVDLIITDSPLFLSAYYAIKGNYHKSFIQYAIDVANEFDNVNFFVHRNHKYDERGRHQNEEQSNTVHEELKQLMKDYSINYYPIVAGEQSCDIMINSIKIHQGLQMNC